MDGIEWLRAKRGREHVTFTEVADHMRDYTGRHPHERDIVERLARFLASREDVPHDHEPVAPGRS